MKKYPIEKLISNQALIGQPDQIDLLHHAAHYEFQATLTAIKEKYHCAKSLTVFISYAWAREEAAPDSLEKAHEHYVQAIAEDLERADFVVLLDKWHDRAGKETTDFVERIVAEKTDFILSMGTKLYLEKYKKRAQLIKDPNHMVRLEGKLLNHLMSFNDQQSEKVIPILLEGTAAESLLPLTRNKIPVSFILQSYFEAMFKLIRDLYRIEPRDQEFQSLRNEFNETLGALEVEEATTEDLRASYQTQLLNKYSKEGKQLRFCRN